MRAVEGQYLRLPPTVLYSPNPNPGQNKVTEHREKINDSAQGSIHLFARTHTHNAHCQRSDPFSLQSYHPVFMYTVPLAVALTSG
ncbi:hypothetical protein DPEC_G00145980 [Dallia pectoralis]|uniref:Uncharacterized protein n=1 Tax=Dallia pectoralis TaxID=75939 RepID=A0ACC2GPE8_DALPE|nr:hypothetical protein DPEC_G00145980 [Dallia pectoralis]